MATITGSPKLVTKEVDLTLNPKGSSTSTAAFVVKSERGPVGVPTLITSVDNFISIFGKPNVQHQGTYNAIAMLSETSILWVMRATDGTASYADSIVRANSLIVSIATGDGGAAPQMQAIATFTDNETPVDVTANANIVWASDNLPVATVDAVGAVTGIQNGTANVSATLDGITHEVLVTIAVP